MPVVMENTASLKATGVDGGGGGGRGGGGRSRGRRREWRGGITNYQEINVWRRSAARSGEERGADRRGQAVGGMKIRARNSREDRMGGGGGGGGGRRGTVGFN